MANCAIVGINWGDEGKGRMVDYLTGQYDVVVRYQGGGNAGHTVINDMGKFALHLLPSGVFRPGVMNILGNGVALDCENLVTEMETIRAAGVSISPENLMVSHRASLLLPWHRELDALEEARLKDKMYGSTKQGIAPFYSDKYQKKTVLAGELLHPEHLKAHLADLLEWKNLTLTRVYGAKGYTMDELTAFQRAVLPYAAGSVYVPPSNILSASGRAILGQRVPQVRTIASSYLEDGTDLPYVQEFGVAADGIVEEPRIVSGGMVNEPYMQLAALSELNFHFVSTHFMHPDDLLDVDRGAAEGWEVYKGGLERYLTWLSTAAPGLRMQTASECAGAIQRFSGVNVTLQSAADAWTLTLGNFTDEAWLLFRANEGVPGRVTGGQLTSLTGELYLLKAENTVVTIERKEG